MVVGTQAEAYATYFVPMITKVAPAAASRRYYEPFCLNPIVPGQRYRLSGFHDVDEHPGHYQHSEA